MKPGYTSANTLFLILVFVCVIMNGSTAAQPGGRLIVLRAANFGWNMALNLKIDGRAAANIVQGGRYGQFVPTGRHILTVSAVPNYQPTSMVLNVRGGQTYVFTAVRQNT